MSGCNLVGFTLCTPSRIQVLPNGTHVIAMNLKYVIFSHEND